MEQMKLYIVSMTFILLTDIKSPSLLNTTELNFKEVRTHVSSKKFRGTKIFLLSDELWLIANNSNNSPRKKICGISMNYD